MDGKYDIKIVEGGGARYQRLRISIISSIFELLNRSGLRKTLDDFQFYC